MISLDELAELENEDPELVPEILPVDARLAVRGPVAKILPLFARAASVTPVKETIEGTGFALLESFTATSSEVAHVRITATDGSMTSSVVMDGLTVVRAGAALLPGKKILDILKSCPTETVQITVLGNSTTIRSGRAQWTVATPVGDSLPPLPTGDDTDLYEVPVANLVAAIASVRKAIGATSGRASLQQAEIRAGYITSCDGNRVHRQHIKGWPEHLDMSLPVAVMEELTRAMTGTPQEEILVGASGMKMVFQLGQDTLVANQLLVPFPNIEKLLLGPAFANENSLTVDTEELSSVVKRIRINADPDYPTTTLALIPGKKDDAGEISWTLAVRARDRTGNTAVESLDCQFVGSDKPSEIHVNHRHLSDLLGAFGGDMAIFKLGVDTKTKKSPVFLEDDSVGFSGILQQMRPLS